MKNRILCLLLCVPVLLLTLLCGCRKNTDAASVNSTIQTESEEEKNTDENESETMSTESKTEQLQQAVKIELLTPKNGEVIDIANPKVREYLNISDTGTAAASEGAKSIISLKTSLDSYNAFYLGLITYTGGVASAADGADKLASGVSDLKDGTAQLKGGASALYDGILRLKNGTPALVDGVTQLKDGAMQLNDGL